MKFLKVKFGLFSLLAILVVSVFLTSCEQDKIALPDVQESELLAAAKYFGIEDGETTFNLPTRFNDADKETVELYLDNMTDEERKELEESYKIEKYLESINRAEEVYNDLGQPDILTLNDLSKYTTEQELADFNSFDVNSVIESRATCFRIFRDRCEFVGTFEGRNFYRKIKQQYCIAWSLTGGGGKWKTIHTSIELFTSC